MNKTKKVQAYFKKFDNNNFIVCTRSYSRQAISIFKAFSSRFIDKKAKEWVFPIFHYNTVLEQLRRCNDLNILEVFKDTTIEYLKYKALNEMDNRN